MCNLKKESTENSDEKEENGTEIKKKEKRKEKTGRGWKKNL